MADYFTHFSCLFDVGTADKAKQALDIYDPMGADDENAGEDDPGQVSCSDYLGFELEIQGGPDSSILWISDEDGGDVESVITFVLRCAEELDLTGLWGFTYADTCNRPRLDAFGGGAHVIDLGARKSVGWTSSQEWLAAALNGEDAHA